MSGMDTMEMYTRSSQGTPRPARWRRWLAGLGLALALGLSIAAGGAARADDKPAGAAADAAKGKDEGWENVSGGVMMQTPGESIPASTLVGVAYGFIWLMVAGYVLFVWRRQSSLAAEIAALRAQIDRAGAPGPSGGRPTGGR